MSFQEFCKTTTITQTAFNPISIIPTIGITISIGGPRNPRQPKDKKPKAGCFSFTWKNKGKENECFNKDKLLFSISAPGNYTNAVKYEVYLAPVNDLSNAQKILDFAYPANSFIVNTNLLDVNKKYVIIVKLFFNSEGLNCARYSVPIERCDQPCLETEAVNDTNIDNQIMQK